MNKKEVILVIGALGQIGAGLTAALRNKHGMEAVVATDELEADVKLQDDGIYERLNVLDKLAIEEIVVRKGITTIYHLSIVISEISDINTTHTWNTQIVSLLNVLDVAKIFSLKVFWPSSLAVFGNNSPKVLCPQHTVTEPITVFGIIKCAGEHLCNYYYEKYGVDVRSLRYPGLISFSSKPAGSIMHYAVDIFHNAVLNGYYLCFLKEETTLPMMYMPDAVRAALELMDAPGYQVKIRTAYNISAMSFSPKNLAAAITTHLPDFTIHYKPDARQKIADSWPKSIDYDVATKDWNWRPKYDLESMTSDMLQQINNYKEIRYS
jgi:nucleoside-diphosphate-sugar epimerase